MPRGPVLGYPVRLRLLFGLLLGLLRNAALPSPMAHAGPRPSPAPTPLLRPESLTVSRPRKAAGPGGAATAARAGRPGTIAANSKRTGAAASATRIASPTIRHARPVSG